jgi:hypothetical protein
LRAELVVAMNAYYVKIQRRRGLSPPRLRCL